MDQLIIFSAGITKRPKFEPPSCLSTWVGTRCWLSVASRPARLPLPPCLVSYLKIGISKNLEIWDPTKSKNFELSKSSSVPPKMLARFGLVGQSTFWLFSCHFRLCFHGPNKCKSYSCVAYFSLWANRQHFLLSTAGGALCEFNIMNQRQPVSSKANFLRY